MTKLEVLLNAYFGTHAHKLDDFLEIVADGGDSVDNMYIELKGILNWLNDEIK